MSSFLVRVCDSDGAAYDRYLLPPAGMSEDDAQALVDAAILRTRTEHPDDFMFDDLAALLTAAGFTVPRIVISSVTF